MRRSQENQTLNLRSLRNNKQFTILTDRWMICSLSTIWTKLFGKENSTSWLSRKNHLQRLWARIKQSLRSQSNNCKETNLMLRKYLLLTFWMLKTKSIKNSWRNLKRLIDKSLLRKIKRSNPLRWELSQFRNNTKSWTEKEQALLQEWRRRFLKWRPRKRDFRKKLTLWNLKEIERSLKIKLFLIEKRRHTSQRSMMQRRNWRNQRQRNKH